MLIPTILWVGVVAMMCIAGLPGFAVYACFAQGVQILPQAFVVSPSVLMLLLANPAISVWLAPVMSGIIQHMALAILLICYWIGGSVWCYWVLHVAAYCLHRPSRR